VTDATTRPAQLAIDAAGIGKRFEIGRDSSYGALYDKVGSMLSRKRSKVAHQGWMWAVRDVDIQVRRGEIFAVIGRNGSGKTTLLKILAKVTAPTEGRAQIQGRVAALLQVGAGFHPQLTGRDNIALSAAITGMTAEEMAEHFDAIVEFSEVGRYIDEPVKTYSSGMYVRLAYSVAAFLPTEIMLIDEVLSVGDVDFQKKSQAHMLEALKDGRSVVYVGHDLDIVRTICDRALVLEGGRVVFRGTADEAADFYKQEIVGHPRPGPNGSDQRG
jgi:lipopolysaccharide transport system ATP-binding protein